MLAQLFFALSSIRPQSSKKHLDLHLICFIEGHSLQNPALVTNHFRTNKCQLRDLLGLFQTITRPLLLRQTGQNWSLIACAQIRTVRIYMRHRVLAKTALPLKTATSLLPRLCQGNENMPACILFWEYARGLRVEGIVVLSPGCRQTPLMRGRHWSELKLLAWRASLGQDIP